MKRHFRYRLKQDGNGRIILERGPAGWWGRTFQGWTHFCHIVESKPEHDTVRWLEYANHPHHLEPARFEDVGHAVSALHVLRDIDRHELNKDEFTTILEE